MSSKPSPHCPICHAPRPSTAALLTFNYLSQLITILAAIAFGIFSVLSWQVGKASTIEARAANQMSIVNICLSNPNFQHTPACARALGVSEELLQEWSGAYCGYIAGGVPVPDYDAGAVTAIEILNKTPGVSMTKATETWDFPTRTAASNGMLDVYSTVTW